MAVQSRLAQCHEKIGDIPAGGFGRLEKWSDGRGTFIARKFFEPHLPGLTPDTTEKLKRRFSREVKVQSQLAGDHVVPILSHDVAARLAIEIVVEDAQDDFLKCAEHISLSKTAFHPRILAALEK